MPFSLAMSYGLRTTSGFVEFGKLWVAWILSKFTLDCKLLSGHHTEHYRFVARNRPLAAEPGTLAPPMLRRYSQCIRESIISLTQASLEGCMRYTLWIMGLQRRFWRKI